MNDYDYVRKAIKEGDIWTTEMQGKKIEFIPVDAEKTFNELGMSAGFVHFMDPETNERLGFCGVTHFMKNATKVRSTDGETPNQQRIRELIAKKEVFQFGVNGPDVKWFNQPFLLIDGADHGQPGVGMGIVHFLNPSDGSIRGYAKIEVFLDEYDPVKT